MPLTVSSAHIFIIHGCTGREAVKLVACDVGTGAVASAAEAAAAAAPSWRHHTMPDARRSSRLRGWTARRR